MWWVVGLAVVAAVVAAGSTLHKHLIGLKVEIESLQKYRIMLNCTYAKQKVYMQRILKC